MSWWGRISIDKAEPYGATNPKGTQTYKITRWPFLCPHVLFIPSIGLESKNTFNELTILLKKKKKKTPSPLIWSHNLRPLQYQGVKGSRLSCFGRLFNLCYLDEKI